MNDKVYSKAEAERIVNDMVSQHLRFGEQYGIYGGQGREQIVNRLWVALNTTDVAKREQVADALTEYAVQCAGVEALLDSSEQHKHSAAVIHALRRYVAKLDISLVKEDFKQRYGNIKGLYLRWGRRKNTQGVMTLSQVRSELYFMMYDDK